MQEEVDQKVISLCVTGMRISKDLELLFYHWYPSLYLTDLLGGFAGAAIFLVYFRYRKLNAKKFRKGEEYGSARWGNEKDIAP